MRIFSHTDFISFDLFHENVPHIVFLYILCLISHKNLIVLCLISQLCPTLCDSMNSSLPGSSVPGDSPGKNTGLGCHALLRGSSQPWD